MNQYKKSRLIVISSLLVLVSVSLLFLTINQNSSLSGLKRVISQPVSFLNRYLALPVQVLSEKEEAIEHLLQTYQENQELKKTIAQLENIEAELDSLKKENASLRNSLSIQEEYDTKQSYPALVTSRVPASWTEQVIINLGEEDGIRKDMLVMANNGLVGSIKEVHETSSVVKLLSNADRFTKIPVKIQTNSGSIYGILSGYDMDNQAFIVSQLNSIVDIPIDSKVVTSDLSGKTPSNLQIGQVLSVETTTSNLNRTLYVKPATDFSNLYSVVVMGETE